jgi:hypothetical protein
MTASPGRQSTQVSWKQLPLLQQLLTAQVPLASPQQSQRPLSCSMDVRLQQMPVSSEVKRTVPSGKHGTQFPLWQTSPPAQQSLAAQEPPASPQQRSLPRMSSRASSLQQESIASSSGRTVPSEAHSSHVPMEEQYWPQQQQPLVAHEPLSSPQQTPPDRLPLQHVVGESVAAPSGRQGTQAPLWHNCPPPQQLLAPHEPSASPQQSSPEMAWLQQRPGSLLFFPSARQ